MASTARPVAFVIAAGVVAAFGLNASPIVPKGKSVLNGLAKVLDIIYDIASYLRKESPEIVPPRVQMVARYRAVLEHVNAAKPPYTHVVIVAHSQGSALSLATLLGDSDRRPPVPALPADLKPPCPVTLLSFGCPARQTYARRFPGQFGQWLDPSLGGDSPLDRWVNVFRSGDYIGREVFDESSTYDPFDSTFRLPRRVERCIGPGVHTGYPSDERWRRIVRHIVATPFPTDPNDALTDLIVPNLN